MKKLLEEIAATAEVMGHELTDAALAIMAGDLAGYQPGDIAVALKRVRQESSRFTLAEIIRRMPNGYIGANEAWASFPKDERETTVVTPEAQKAWAAACPLMSDGDKIGARMAFIETYDRAVAESESRTPRYAVTLGHDRNRRADPIIQAVELGRLPPAKAHRYLPDLGYDGKDALRLEHAIQAAESGIGITHQGEVSQKALRSA